MAFAADYHQNVEPLKEETCWPLLPTHHRGLMHTLDQDGTCGPATWAALWPA